MVSADKIQPQPDKLAAIRDWPTPHCLRYVRAFYGLASNYRKFVRDFARIAEPLSRMTKKNTPFLWTDETQQSFEELKTVRRRYPSVSDSRHTMYLGHRRFRCRSWRWSMELRSPSPTSPASSMAHEGTTAPRGENYSLSHNVASTLQTLPVG